MSCTFNCCPDNLYLAFGTRPVTSRFNENTSAASCQSILKSWLTQCNDHDACKIQRQPFLPTRLLDLGDVSTNGIVRLVLSVNIDQPARYVTLSHCWGGSVPLQLREETKQNMIDGLDLRTFPKTFRDAIEVARWADGSLASLLLIPKSITNAVFSSPLYLDR
jgi:hypothetical protein